MKFGLGSVDGATTANFYLLMRLDSCARRKDEALGGPAGAIQRAPSKIAAPREVHSMEQSRAGGMFFVAWHLLRLCNLGSRRLNLVCVLPKIAAPKEVPSMEKSKARGVFFVA